MCAKLTIDQARERVRRVNPDEIGIIHNWGNRLFLEALFTKGDGKTDWFAEDNGNRKSANRGRTHHPRKDRRLF
jgi:hypothetical protein